MVKNLFYWMVCAFVVFLFWSVSSRIQKQEAQWSFSYFLSRVEAGQVDEVVFRGQQIVGDTTTGQVFRTVAPAQSGEGLLTLLRANDVEILARDEATQSWLGHLISWIPIAIMVAFLVFFMRQLNQPTQAASAWNDDQRREMKLSILYRLAGGESEVSEDEIVAALTEPGRPKAAAPAAEVRRIVYEMLSEGTLELTKAQTFRARHVAPND